MNEKGITDVVKVLPNNVGRLWRDMFNKTGSDKPMRYRSNYITEKVKQDLLGLIPHSRTTEWKLSDSEKWDPFRLRKGERIGGLWKREDKLLEWFAKEENFFEKNFGERIEKDLTRDRVDKKVYRFGKEINELDKDPSFAFE